VAPGCRDDTVAARARAFLVISVPKPRDTPVLNQTVRAAKLGSFEEVVPLSRRETARY